MRFVLPAIVAVGLSPTVPAAAQSYWAPEQCKRAQDSVQKLADAMGQLQSTHASAAAIQAEKGQIAANQAAVAYYCQARQPNSELGSIRPHYLVMFVIYAPPGSASAQPNGAAISKVDYNSSSTAGSTVSSSKSLKFKAQLTASIEGNAFGAKTSISVSASKSTQSSTKSDQNIKKSTSLDVSDTGPAADGINHDADEIWLWTNPSVTLIPNGVNLTAALGTVGGRAVSLQFLSVGQIKSFIAQPGCANLGKPSDTSACQNFKSSGFTTSDYQAMLTADPFANGDVTPDPNRFVETSTTFPYEPGGQNVTFTAENETTNTSTEGTIIEKELSVSVGFGYDSDAVKAMLTDQNTWTWTHETSQAMSLGTSQKASATIGAPSTNWQGSQNIAVYFDTLWNTFLFRYLDTSGNPILLTGTIFDAAGHPLARQRVTLSYPGRIRRTYSNSEGRYYFYGTAPNATGKIAAGPVPTRPVSLLKQAQMLNLSMTKALKVPLR